MDLLLTPEQDEIVSSVSSLLSTELPIARLRELMAGGMPFEAAVWRQCAAQGWFGIGLAEHDGGAGYGLAEEALLFREIGRHLAPGPFLSTALGARLLTGSAREDVLDGSARVALVELTGGDVDAEEVRGDALLHDHPDAELGLVATPGGAALINLADLTDVVAASSIDPATSLATARADSIPPVTYVSAATDPIFDRGAVLASAMASGIAEATRDRSAEHARNRVQFGRPIGVNQAIKHACTDMAVRAELAANQTFFAAMTLDDGRPDAAFQVASAKVVATAAALDNARATIQVHGGLGFTWEHDAHLYLKRAHILAEVFGSRHHHLAALIELPPAQ